MVAYAVATSSPLADPVAIDWFTIGAAPAPPSTLTDSQWQNGLRLVGYNDLPATLAPQAAFTVRLLWSTTAALADDYTAFVHLVGPDGAIVAQNDRPPLAGFYPTSGWALDDPVDDLYALTLPETLPPGTYRLLVGWYQPTTGERLRLSDNRDEIELTTWVVQ